MVLGCDFRNFQICQVLGPLEVFIGVGFTYVVFMKMSVRACCERLRCTV